MKFLMLVPAFFFSIFGLEEQFAFVADKDGYVNVRSGEGMEYSIVDTLHNGRLIYCSERRGNWFYISYTKGKEQRYGLIYHDRCKLISEYNPIPEMMRGDNSITLGKDSIKIVASERAFDKSRHKYSYYKDRKDEIELIDNKQYWGTDGFLPETEYKAISITIGKKVTILPAAALQNLYEIKLHHFEANFDRANNIVYLHSWNSDGAGAYNVIWKIDNGVYKERFIVYGF